MEEVRQASEEATSRKAIGTVVPCAFCLIIRGDVEPPLNYQADNSVVSFTPLNPVVPGHRLFVPRFHVQDAAESPLWAGIVFMAAADYATRRRNAFNLITSAGEWASQTIMHLHVHYVPRQPNDKIKLPWS